MSNTMRMFSAEEIKSFQEARQRILDNLFEDLQDGFENYPATEIVEIDKLEKLLYSKEVPADKKGQLRFYFKSYKKIGGGYVKYRNTGVNGIGRDYGDNSIGNMPYQVQNTVLDELVWDTDGENMCYNIYAGIYNLLRNGDSTVPELNHINRYIIDRGTCTNKVLDHYFKNHARKEDYKWYVKKLFTTILNEGGKGAVKAWKDEWSLRICDNSMPDIISNLIEEVEETTKFIFSKIPKKFHLKSKKRDKLTLSNFIYSIEKKCTFMHYMTAGRPRQYIYTKDGLKLYKSTFSEERMKEIQNETKEAIRSTYGIDITYKIKDVDPSDKIDVDNMIIDEFSYEYMKAEFEENHCKIIDSKLNYAKITIDDTFLFRNKTEMVNSYAHMKYTEATFNKKTKEYEELEFSFIERWVKDKDIRLYEAMKVVPRNCPDNIYNLWTSFAVEKMEQVNNEYDYAEEIKFILNHIKILCGDDEPIYNYFIKWIGQMLKFPEVKSEVAVLFISLNGGAGKGSLIRMLEKMLGHHKIIETQSPERDVWGDFNSLMADGYLVVLDELERLQTSKTGMSRLKGLITEPTCIINGKCKDPIKTASFHRFIGASNKLIPLESKKGERKSLIIRCNEKLAEKTLENKAYFEKYYDIIADKDFIIKMYQYFINLEGLDDFRKIIVPTSAYQEMLNEANVCVIEQFVKYFVADRVNKTNGKCTISAIEFYQQFKQWAESNGFKYETSTIKIGLRLQTLLTEPHFKKDHARAGAVYTFNISTLAKHFKIQSDEELLLDNVSIDDYTTEETMSETATAKDCDNEIEDNDFIDTIMEIVEKTESNIEDNLSDDDDNEFIKLLLS